MLDGSSVETPIVPGDLTNTARPNSAANPGVTGVSTVAVISAAITVSIGEDVTRCDHKKH